MAEENVIIKDVMLGRGSYRNFSGVKTEYNRAGNRVFSIFLPEETASILRDEGWNVKFKPAKRDDQDDRWQLDISVGFDRYPPTIKVISADGTVSYLSEENVGILDSADIEGADLEIRPYNWEVNGKTGTKAYLRELEVRLRPPRRTLSGAMFSDEDDDTI